ADEIERAGERSRGSHSSPVKPARAQFATQMRLLRVKSVFLGNANAQAVEIVGERNLAGKARVRVAVVARIEQVVLVGADRRQLVDELGIDVDVAGRARAAAAAQGEELVETVVADRLHYREAARCLDLAGFARAGGHDQLGHGVRLPFCCAGLLRDWRPVWQAEEAWV